MTPLREELAGVLRSLEAAHWIADKLHQDIDRISDLTDLQAEPLHIDGPPAA